MISTNVSWLILKMKPEFDEHIQNQDNKNYTNEVK